MRTNIIKSIVALSLPLIFLAGCAKDQVKPDEGMAAPPAVKESKTPVAADTSAADKAAADKAAREAAERQAREKAAAEKAAADRAAAERAAAEKAAADKAAAEMAALEKSLAAVKTVYFDFDSFVLSQAARDDLQGNADILIKKYKGKVVIGGHADERGSSEYNLALSEKRAKAVMAYLVNLGVPADRLSVVGYGMEKPQDAGHTEESWAKNRRAEFSAAK